jgi:protein-S-isoprenylcysteine O-methyltransferase Ste14
MDIPLSSLQAIIGVLIVVIGAWMTLNYYNYWNKNYKGKLLTGGPYRYLRHPNYAGFLYIVVGSVIIIPIAETIALALFTPLFLIYFIGKEEKQLLKLYGQRYEEYKKNVRWRLIPRIY